jgi:hypothetical protein
MVSCAAVPVRTEPAYKPAWVTNPRPDTFVGVSRDDLNNEQDARHSAENDAIVNAAKQDRVFITSSDVETFKEKGSGKTVKTNDGIESQTSVYTYRLISQMSPLEYYTEVYRHGRNLRYKVYVLSRRLSEDQKPVDTIYASLVFKGNSLTGGGEMDRMVLTNALREALENLPVKIGAPPQTQEQDYYSFIITMNQGRPDYTNINDAIFIYVITIEFARNGIVLQSSEQRFSEISNNQAFYLASRFIRNNREFFLKALGALL